MAGLSFPGIIQLFIAKMHPPGLAAISPMSVLADTTSSCLMPGGIYNNGFALAWIENVLDKAAPYAHGWITDLVEAGDTSCEENQKLHALREDAVGKALENRVETVYREALAELFHGPTDIDHVMDMLKLREIYRHLSNAADRGDQAANVIGDIVVKMT